MVVSVASSSVVSGASVYSQETLPPSIAWRRAVDRYRHDPSLTEKEQEVLELKSLKDFVGDLQNVDLSHLQKSRVRKSMEILRPLCQALDRFSPALDVMSQADPHGVLALLWGSIRMCLIVAKDMAEFYSDLVGFFTEIEDILGRLTAYEELFKDNRRFNVALCAVFESLLDYCAFIRQKLRSKPRTIARLVFTASLKKEAALKISHFRALCIKTESEAQLAGTEANVKFQKTAGQYFKEVTEAQTESAQKVTAVQQNDLLKQLHETLAPVPIAEYLDRLQRRRFQGTCSWVMSSRAFSHLLEKDSKRKPHLTWITGVPGSGKTYLTAYLIERLQAFRSVGYFFCDTKDASKKNASNVLRTWAWQLCEKASAVAGEATRLLGPGTEITTSLLRKLFSVVFQHTPSCYLILDGLDECDAEERREILESLGDLAREATVVIISRREANIDRILRDMEEQKLEIARIHIDPSDNKKDIQRYIEKQVDELGLKDSILLTKIIHGVAHKAGGMFLYARLLLNELRQTDTDEEKHEVLENLPEGIDQVYSRSMDKIRACKTARRARLVRLLQCVIYASRPLTLPELEVALAITVGEEAFRSGNIPDVEKLFLEYCTSLLEMDTEVDTLACIHATAKEYLMRLSAEERLTNKVVAHANLASICLTYLNYTDRGFVDRTEADVTAIPFNEPWPWFEYLHPPFWLHAEEHRLLQYSTANWVYHAAQIAAELHISDSVAEYLGQLKKLLNSEERIVRWFEFFHFMYTEDLDLSRYTGDTFDSWILQYEDTKYGQEELGAIAAKRNVFDTFTFSFNGFALVDTAQADALRKEKTLYPSAQQLEVLGNSWESAMTHLGFSGPRGVFRWRRYTKIEATTRKPLHMAAYFNFTGLLHQMLDAGADVNERCAMDRNVANQAAFGESTSALKLLREAGADANHTPAFTFFDGNRPLMDAFFDDQFVPLRQRDYSTARYMMDSGVLIHSAVCDLTPLHTIFDFWTESEDQMSTLRKVLQHTKDIVSLLETPSPYTGLTPAHIAARNNLPQTLRLYLEQHPDPRRYAAVTWGADKKTALHESCYHAASQCGPILIDLDIDVDAAGVISQSRPLHIAASSRSDMLHLLLNRADANARDATGRTPLHLAAIGNWADGVQALLAYTSDLNSADKHGFSPLAAALASNAQAAVAALRAAGAAHVSMPGSASHWPRSTSDVYSSYHALSCAFHLRAPSELLRHIIDMSEYWLVSSTFADHPSVVEQADCGRPYLCSRPIPVNGTQLRKVRIKIKGDSVEGEPTALFPERRTWTWFRLAKQPSQMRVEAESAGVRPETLIAGPKLVDNDVDATDGQNHDIAIHLDQFATQDIPLWLGRMQKGESICIVPMARWPGRQNKVFFASVDVYTTCLKSATGQLAGQVESARIAIGWLGV